MEGDGPDEGREDPGESVSDGACCSGEGGGAGRRFCSRAASDSVGVGGFGGEPAELEDDEAKGEERWRRRLEQKQVVVLVVVGLILAFLPICSILVEKRSDEVQVEALSSVSPSLLTSSSHPAADF